VRAKALIVILFLAFLLAPSRITSGTAFGNTVDCLDSTSATTGYHSIHLGEKRTCPTVESTVVGGSASSSGPRIETVDCGRVKVGVISENSPNHFCSAVQGSCSVQSRAQAPADPKATTVGFLQQNPSGTWELNGFDCNVVPGAGPPPPPQVTPFDAYAAVLKLVPSPAIGVAPGKGRTLVNMETIFWVNSAADQSLGPVTLLGHQVGLRIHARAAAWAFGDGSTDTSAGLGRPYGQREQHHQQQSYQALSDSRHHSRHVNPEAGTTHSRAAMP